MILFQEIGHLGKVVTVLDSGDIRVLYCGDKTFIINQQALTKVSVRVLISCTVLIANASKMSTVLRMSYAHNNYRGMSSCTPVAVY